MVNEKGVFERLKQIELEIVFTFAQYSPEATYMGIEDILMYLASPEPDPESGTLQMLLDLYQQHGHLQSRLIEMRTRHPRYRLGMMRASTG